MLAQHRQGPAHKKGRQEEDGERQEELGEDKQRRVGLENFKERRIERAVHSQQQKVQQGGNPDTDFEKAVGSEQV